MPSSSLIPSLLLRRSRVVGLTKVTSTPTLQTTIRPSFLFSNNKNNNNKKLLKLNVGRFSTISKVASVSEEQIESLQDEYNNTNSSSYNTGDIDTVNTDKHRKDSISHDENLLYRDVKVADVLKSKENYGNTVHSVYETDSVLVAVEMMNMFGIGAILVRNQQGNISGIMSTRDYMMKVGVGEAHPKQALVKDIMKRETPYINSDESMLSGLHSMLENCTRYLIVRDCNSKKEIGLISIGDAVRNLLSQFRETSSQMQQMVRSSYSYSESTISNAHNINKPEKSQHDLHQ